MYGNAFLNLQITRSDIRPHIKWAVSLVICIYGHFNFPRGLCGYVWVNILIFITPRVILLQDDNKGSHLDFELS